MSETPVSNAEYQALLRDSAEKQVLEQRVKDLEEESKNKSVALDEARKKAKEKQEDLKNQLEEKDTLIKDINSKLELKEGQNLDDRLEELKSNGEKYEEILEQKKAESTENISKYSELLGEEFMKEKESLFEGISDEKKEILLKDYVDSKGLLEKEKKEQPGVGTEIPGGKAPDEQVSNFDKALSSGASGDDLFRAMAENIKHI